MFRQMQQMQENNMEQEQFVTRLAHLPMMSTALSQLGSLYSSAKCSNKLAKFALETAESSMFVVVNTSKPIFGQFEKQIGMLDSYACSQLDWAEEKYPILKKPVDEAVAETKEKVTEVLKPTMDRVETLRRRSKETIDYGRGKVHSLKVYTTAQLEAMLKMGSNNIITKVMLENADHALCWTDSYIDYYVPPVQGSERKNDQSQKFAAAAGKPLTRAGLVGSKVYNRVYGHAQKQMLNTVEKTLAMANEVQELLVKMELSKIAFSATNEAGKRITRASEYCRHVWSEVRKSDEEAVASSRDGSATNELSAVEQQMIATTRQLLGHVQTGTAWITTIGSSYMPTTLNNTLKVSLDHVTNACTQFANIGNVQELPSWALAATREQMSKVASTLSDVFDYAASTSLADWIIPDFELGELDLEEDAYVSNGPNGIGYVPYDTIKTEN